MWPGFGENFRVLKWILERCEGKSNAVESEIGRLPESIDFEGLDISMSTSAHLFAVDNELWMEEIKEIEKFYEKLDYIPEELEKQLAELKERVEILS